MSPPVDTERQTIDCVKAALGKALENHLFAHAEVDDAHVLSALCELTASAGVAAIGMNGAIDMLLRLTHQLQSKSLTENRFVTK